MTSAVDWVLKCNYLYLSICVCVCAEGMTTCSVQPITTLACHHHPHHHHHPSSHKFMGSGTGSHSGSGSSSGSNSPPPVKTEPKDEDEEEEEEDCKPPAPPTAPAGATTPPPHHRYHHHHLHHLRHSPPVGLLNKRNLVQDEKLVVATLASLNSGDPSNIIKQDLRLIIQSRRKAEGKGELQVDFKTPPKDEVGRSSMDWRKEEARIERVLFLSVCLFVGLFVACLWTFCERSTLLSVSV